jgi:hypothetical protein
MVLAIQDPITIVAHKGAGETHTEIQTDLRRRAIVTQMRLTEIASVVATEISGVRGAGRRYEIVTQIEGRGSVMQLGSGCRIVSELCMVDGEANVVLLADMAGASIRSEIRISMSRSIVAASPP